MARQPADRFAEKIGRRLDLDQFAGYLAATWILVNIDRYVGMPHNYYLLMDKADGRLRILPRDLMKGFGTFTSDYEPETPLQWGIERPRVSQRRVLERLFGMASFRSRYREAVVPLMENVFTRERMFSRVAEMEQALTPCMKGRRREDFRLGTYGDRDGINVAVERCVSAIRRLIEQRIDSVRGQLRGEARGKRLTRRQ
ncbi:MAG: CotH kinase family protein [Planctomycetota bacterium]|nr:CotH kinase family protein [Planctomycetota bacterium]